MTIVEKLLLVAAVGVIGAIVHVVILVLPNSHWDFLIKPRSGLRPTGLFYTYERRDFVRGAVLWLLIAGLMIAAGVYLTAVHGIMPVDVAWGQPRQRLAQLYGVVLVMVGLFAAGFGIQHTWIAIRWSSIVSDWQKDKAE